jgi:hypothetical protein
MIFKEESDMSEKANRGIDKNNLFSFLYRTRIKVFKGDVAILNLSLFFSALAILFAPWVAVIGAVVALVLGYRFGFEKNAADFGGTIESVFKGAAGNAEKAEDAVTDQEGNGAEG